MSKSESKLKGANYSSSDFSSTPNEFLEEQHELLEWPYTIHRIDRTLDLEMIEARGKQQLFSAMRNKTLVAFVGSGFSMAYGRLGWQAWQDRQIKVIRKLATQFLTCADCSRDVLKTQREFLDLYKVAEEVDPEFHRFAQGWQAKCSKDPAIEGLQNLLTMKTREIEFRRSEVQELYETFESLTKEGDFPGGESQPLIFECATQLLQVVQSTRTLFLGYDVEVDTSSSSDTNEVTNDRVGFSISIPQSGVPRSQSTQLLALAELITDICDWLATHSSTKIKFLQGWNLNNELLIVFRQLHANYGAYAKAVEKFRRDAKASDARLDLADMAKHLLVDEVAHAGDIVRQGVEYSVEAGRTSYSQLIKKKWKYEDINEQLRVSLGVTKKNNLRRSVGGIREVPERFATLGFFTNEAFSRVVKKLEKLASDGGNGVGSIPTYWKPVFNGILSELVLNKKQILGPRGQLQRKFISPTHRYMLAVMLALLEDPYKTFIGWCPKDNKKRRGVKIRDDVDRDDMSSRRSLIDESLDPLNHMALKLGCTQYLTLNYDFEIERFFQDRGYRHYAESESGDSQDMDSQSRSGYRTDHRGGVLVDYDFTRETAADLINFSSDHEESDASVFHLHGRADQSSRLVITESDYRDQYLRGDELSETVEESIRVGFAANPMLFVGTGMSESEVLRPLRQFVTDKGSAANRSAIVLLAGTNDRHARTKMATTLYLRYGAHAVHFGHGEVLEQKFDDSPSVWREVDWLYHVSELISWLKGATSTIQDGLLALADYKENPKEIDQLEANDQAEKTDRVEKRRKERYENACLWLEKSCDERLDLLVEALGQLPAQLASDNSGPPFALEVLLDARFVNSSEGSRWNELLSALDNRAKTNGQNRRLAEVRFPGSPGKFDVSSEACLSQELSLLAELVIQTVTFDIPISIVWNRNFEDLDEQASKHVYAALRDLSARKIALDGVKNALMTATLCLALEGLEKEAHVRWRELAMSPPNRVPHLAESKAISVNGVEVPHRFVRHWLDPVNSCVGPQWHSTDRTRPTGVIAFDNFVTAISQRASKPDHSYEIGRRLWLVISPKGFGKGAFFSAFTSDIGLASYIQAVKGCEARCLSKTEFEKNQIISTASLANVRLESKYAGAVFLNLSFSTEIASTFDMLIGAVHKAARLAADNANLSSKHRIRSLYEKYSEEHHLLSRIERLTDVFVRFGELSRAIVMEAYDSGEAVAVQPRILVCINALELMHLADGLTKNREIENILDLLLNRSTQNVALDLVLLSNENRLGEFFLSQGPRSDAHRNFVDGHDKPLRPRNCGKLYKFVAVTREDTGAEVLSEMLQRAARSDVGGVEALSLETGFDANGGTTALHPLPASEVVQAGDSEESGEFLEKLNCSVYFARSPRLVEILVHNFSALACTLYIANLESELNAFLRQAGQSSKHFDVLRSVLDRLQTSKMDVLDANKLKLTINQSVWNDDRTGESKDEQIGLGLDREKRVGRKLKHFVEVIYKEIPEDSTDRELESLADRLVLLKDDLDNLRKNRVSIEERARVHLLKRYSRGYAQRDAVHREWRRIRRLLRGNRYCLTLLLAAAQRVALADQSLLKGGQAAESFIFGTVDRMAAVSEESRETVLLDQVFNVYEQFQVYGEPRDDHELHLLILRHLGVIGIPCSADVLVRAPAIRDYFSSITKHDDRRRYGRLTEALDEMTKRGFVFRLQPSPRLEETWSEAGGNSTGLENELQQKKRDFIFGPYKPEEEYRYALHRLVQRHIVHKLGGGRREFVEINSFAPSMYASMHSDLPRLSFEAYRFLSSLVASFSQYPDQLSRGPGAESWHLGGAPLSTRVQALRAAMSTVRSVFSIGVVSRFQEYQNDDAKQYGKTRGYFEEYRIQVRWLIRKAAELVHPKPDLWDYVPERPELDHIAAFYRDEIVWLHNECGVVSLVQGNLMESVSMLRQAITLNREIEGNGDDGPQHNRIAVNLAIAQIERGRLVGAATLLKRVKETEGIEVTRIGRVSHIAVGYLGLIQLIRGNLHGAEDMLEAAIRALRAYNDSRACSIFLRHRADLYRLNGDLANAQIVLRESILFAEGGGHEDLYNYSRLVGIRLDLADTATQSNNQALQGLITRTKVVERYAEVMEMPALLCDGQILRASILLERGDSSLAGGLLSNAITLAKRNGMALRLNAAMVWYARVLLYRGQPEQALSVIRSSHSMAQRQGNQLGLRDADQVIEEIARGRDRGGSGM